MTEVKLPKGWSGERISDLSALGRPIERAKKNELPQNLFSETESDRQSIIKNLLKRLPLSKEDEILERAPIGDALAQRPKRDAEIYRLIAEFDLGASDGSKYLTQGTAVCFAHGQLLTAAHNLLIHFVDGVALNRPAFAEKIYLGNKNEVYEFADYWSIHPSFDKLQYDPFYDIGLIAFDDPEFSVPWTPISDFQEGINVIDIAGFRDPVGYGETSAYIENGTTPFQLHFASDISHLDPRELVGWSGGPHFQDLGIIGIHIGTQQAWDGRQYRDWAIGIAAANLWRDWFGEEPPLSQV